MSNYSGECTAGTLEREDIFKPLIFEDTFGHQIRFNLRKQSPDKLYPNKCVIDE